MKRTNQDKFSFEDLEVWQEAVVFAGGQLPMTVQRNGQTRALVLALEAYDGEQIAGQRLNPKLRGVELQNFRSPDGPEAGAGILVTELAFDSPAGIAGLRKGDVIVAVNRQPVQNIDDLREAIRAETPQLVLRLFRSGQFGTLVIR